MRERLRQEDGIALVLALACCLALSTLVFGITTYVTSNQRSASNSSNASTAQSYAEAALNMAYGRLYFSKSSTGQLKGLSPTTPTLLGCTASATTAGASDCTSPTPLCVGISGTCPTGTYSATAGTASVYGFFTGTDPPAGATFLGVTEQADEWVLLATGYTRGANGSLTARTLKASVLVTGGGHGAVASVWNHVFLTMPAPNSTTCTQTIDGNGTTWTAPLYVIGNLCLVGNNDMIKEVAGGQKIDIQIGGKLVLAGNGSSASTVGDWTTSPVTGITSGVVVGNCAATIAGTAKDCATNFKYKVNSVDTFITQNDPELDTAGIEKDYTSFDPGPRHTCLAGTSPAPLADKTFDYDVSTLEQTTPSKTTTWLPDNSGSVTSGGAFELTPAYSYACISQSGTGTGYLIWNNDSINSLTVGGITVKPKTLAVNGNMFFDSNMTITQSLTYAGTAIIMVAGQITLLGNSQTICAQNTNCVFTNWQGTTGHNDMLTLATVLKNSSTAISFTGQQQTFQGSMWAPTSSKVAFTGNGYEIEGPLAAGAMNILANTFHFDPLPVIANMPLGAPVPPNVSVTINPMTVLG